jgi:hypothetical protein
MPSSTSSDFDAPDLVGGVFLRAAGNAGRGAQAAASGGSIVNALELQTRLQAP